MKTPEEMAERRYPGLSAAHVGFREGVAADRSHLCSLLEGIRSAHSAGGELEQVGYAAEVMALVARMGVVT